MSLKILHKLPMTKHNLSTDYFIKIMIKGSNEIAQYIKMFALKPKDLTFMTNTYSVEGENQFPQVVL